MKTLTRFLEAEINGKYALEFYRSIGIIIQQTLDWSCYLWTMTLDTMERSELNSLCQTLGVYNPIVEVDGFDSYLTLPQYGTHKTDDGYSGSGVRELKRISDLEWREVEMTGTEINDQATQSDRTGLVEEGARALGYIPYDVQAFDGYGNVRPEAILPSPPIDKPYSEWYGNKYLYLASSAFVYAFLSDEDLKRYMKLMQSLRNGRPSWSKVKDICDFLDIQEVMVLTIDTAYAYPWQMHIEYELKTGNYSNRAKRIALFRNIFKLKFPQVYLEDVT